MDRAILVVFLSGVLSATAPIISISGPKKLRALNGSCLHIPCNFTVKNGDFNESENVVARWFKNDTYNLIFDSQKEMERKYPMKVVGDLSLKNCTTVFYNLTTDYSGIYFFRVEGGTAEAQYRINITVKESPWRPQITITGEERENSLVTLTCSFNTPCPQAPPTLTWNLSQAPPYPTGVLLPNPAQLIYSNWTFTTKIQLHNLTLTHLHDRVPITCLAEYPVTSGIETSKKKIILNITYAPKNTLASISSSGGLWFSQVSLSCSSTANPPVQNFSWFKVSTKGPVHVFKGSLYSFNITNSGHYYCMAYNRLGNQSSSVIELSPAAPLMWGVIGGGVGLLVFICLGVCFWCFLCKRKAGKQGQREDCIDANSVHYAEVDFLKLRRKSGPDTEPDEEQGAEPVYSQIRVKQLTAPTQDI